MDINSIFQYNYQAITGMRNVNENGKADRQNLNSEQKLLEAAELADFKRRFYDDLSKMVPYKTNGNTTLIISEAAFLEMKNNPEYREKVLSLIARDWGSSCGPRKYKVLITVGADLKDYRASSWPVSSGQQYKARRTVKKIIYKRLRKKKLEKKEQVEEYLDGKMMIRRLTQILRNEEAANEMLLRRYKELRECI